MIERPSTRPRKYEGSDARLSSEPAPGIRVFTTIQQITAVTSMNFARSRSTAAAVPERGAGTAWLR